MGVPCSPLRRTGSGLAAAFSTPTSCIVRIGVVAVVSAVRKVLAVHIKEYYCLILWTGMD
jgi:hypothetical protein